MQIIRSGSQPATKGAAEWFAGNVVVEPLISVEEPAAPSLHSTLPALCQKKAMLVTFQSR